ncbi:MAG: alpha-1,4-glucan--maltose-1-phosphate maltosyltransferase [Alphaproteobacteria bacterium]
MAILVDVDAATAEAGALASLSRAGVVGFRCLAPDRRTAADWAHLMAATRLQSRDCLFLAWTPGLSREAMRALAGAGFDAVFASTAWWDGRAGWFAEEHEALRMVAPVISVAGPADGTPASGGMLRIAAATGDGLFMLLPGAANDGSAFSGGADDGAADIREANALVGRIAAAGFHGELRPVAASAHGPTVLVRADAGDIRAAGRVLVVLANPDRSRARDAKAFLEGLPPAAGAAFGRPVPFEEDRSTAPDLAPGEIRLLVAERTDPVRSTLPDGNATALAAAAAPRILIEHVTPSVDGGRFPAKRIAGEQVVVEADIWIDGHEKIAAEILWRPADEAEWRGAPMRHMGNDRWRGAFPVDRLGRHVFTVEAWADRYASLHHELTAKRAARRDLSLEALEGCHLVAEALARTPADAPHHAPLARLAAALPDTGGAGTIDLLLDDATAAVMAAADDRPFRVRHDPPLAIEADRPHAAFAAWYELFPRSVTSDPARHGTFADVIGRLPAIRAMGFDTLYFPPIHPIGRVNRKGRNNSLTAGQDDAGSPYAIGAAEGGHDALHPELGTLDDFRRLRDAASAHGLEIALDFAIQCSPDHPWLRQHPDWFRWRPDGSLRYAENPPKKYEDIVNVDFYAAGAVPSLWLALRDVVLFWAAEGIRCFRVDNPHTKPLPFWEWLIAEVRARHPDALFLSEAFTRPKMMARLAKLGFSQSYTYFTWRNTKQELTEYLTELTTTDAREFFRPHFFVNTPDINPVFLQTSGRAGFLIRAALAATLSGLWGVYSGFELCEAAPLPGREEYLDSEKYEIRVRPPRAPGDIVDEIALLNRIRRANPALQDHRNLAFYAAYDPRVLLYGKRAEPGADMILVAVNLDPHAVVECDFEAPLWEWGLPDHGALLAEDLLRGGSAVWTGKQRRLRLDPADLPFAIWRLAPPERTLR